MAQEPITARPGGNIHEIASTVIASQMGTKYDNGEFNITDGTEDYDVSGESDLFNNITKAHVVSIRCTGTISVKFNSTSNDSITIRKADSPAAPCWRATSDSH